MQLPYSWLGTRYLSRNEGDLCKSTFRIHNSILHLFILITQIVAIQVTEHAAGIFVYALAGNHMGKSSDRAEATGVDQQLSELLRHSWRWSSLFVRGWDPLRHFQSAILALQNQNRIRYRKSLKSSWPRNFWKLVYTKIKSSYFLSKLNLGKRHRGKFIV